MTGAAAAPPASRPCAGGSFHRTQFVRGNADLRFGQRHLPGVDDGFAVPRPALGRKCLARKQAGTRDGIAALPHEFGLTAHEDQTRLHQKRGPVDRMLVAGFLEDDIEEVERDGVKLRVYSVAKTVADCFKHGNKIGLDVALEALKDARAHNKASVDDIWRYANVCRVANVMRPCLESIG